MNDSNLPHWLNVLCSYLGASLLVTFSFVASVAMIFGALWLIRQGYDFIKDWKEEIKY